MIAGAQAVRYDALFDVAGEIVVITGACGQLGTSYVKAFLGRGSRVVGLDLKSSPANSDLAGEFCSNYMFVEADVTDAASLRSVRDTVAGQFGAPTVLINNAAIDSPPTGPLDENGPFEHYPESSWDRVLDVNLKGVYLCCQIFGSAMAQAGRGSIVNVASIYGLVAPDQSLYQYRRDRGEIFYKPVAYSASKSGVLNLTRYLAAYWGRSGVRVNSLTIAGVYNNQDAQFLEKYCSRIPVGRMASVTEYNGAVLFLASAASAYMTGSNLIVDGGWTAI